MKKDNKILQKSILKKKIDELVYLEPYIDDTLQQLSRFV